MRGASQPDTETFTVSSKTCYVTVSGDVVSHTTSARDRRG